MLGDELLVHGDQNVQVPAHLNFGKYMLDKLRLRNNETALENAGAGSKFTYKQFTQYAVNMSVALTKLGVRKGDVIAFGSEKRYEFLPTALAIVFTGATYIPHELKIGKATLLHQMKITNPKYFICTNYFWNTYSDILKSFNSIKQVVTLDDSVDSAVSIRALVTDVDVNRFEPVEVQGQIDTAFIVFSSGTTGMPKGVQVTHLNCILNSLPDDPADESLQTAFMNGEWNHNYDMFMAYKYLARGGKVVFTDTVTPESFLKSVNDCGVNIAFLIPSIISYLSKTKDIEKYNLESLKIIYSASCPLHNNIIQAVKSRFPQLKNVWQGYGMTETGKLTSEWCGNKGPKHGSVGRVLPGVTLKVVDTKTRKTLGPNQRGEVCLRGPLLMKGYIGVDPSTYLEDGFFKTGDLGYYDTDGYFYIVERLKEIIMYDGFNVVPLELETILQLHAGVREAGVVGKPVPVFGEEPTAFVVKQPGADVTEQELVDYVAAEVPPYMQLFGGVKFIEELPKNPRGKNLRKNLRDMLKDWS